MCWKVFEDTRPGTSLVCSGLPLVLDVGLSSSVCLVLGLSLALVLSGLPLVLDARLSFLSWLAGHLALLLSSIMLQYDFLRTLSSYPRLLWLLLSP